MKIIIVICILLSQFTTAYAKSPEGLINENLLQDFPFPDGQWSVSQGMIEDANILETRWLSDSSDDMVQTFVIYNKTNGDVKKSKVIDNTVGRENCDLLFKSDVMSDKAENGYSQLTWYSECKTSSGFYSKAIHKSIAGNDSMYEFKRIFRGKPTDKEWQSWVDYISEVKVCDSRLPDQACPEDMKKYLGNE